MQSTDAHPLLNVPEILKLLARPSVAKLIASMSRNPATMDSICEEQANSAHHVFSRLIKPLKDHQLIKRDNTRGGYVLNRITFDRVAREVARMGSSETN